MPIRSAHSLLGHEQSQRAGVDARSQVCQILGVGTASPEHRIEQAEAARFAVELGMTKRYTKSLPMLYRQAGVENRHSVLLNDSIDQCLSTRQSFYPIATDPSERGPTTRERMQAFCEHAPGLALAASQSALVHAGLPADQVTHLITISCSGFGAPGVDFALIDGLDLPPTVQRTNVGFMGCHAALNGMRIARAICESQPSAVVLLCAIELCSLHQQYTDNAQQLVANALFADGSAALVLVGADAARQSCSDEAETNHFVRDNRSYVLPNTRDMMSWHIGDHGFEMSLSPKVPDIIQRDLVPWISGWLEQHALKIEDIQDWIIHPGGPRIVTACGEALGLSHEQIQPSIDVLANFGNMSSPTVLFVLEQFMSRKCATSHQVILAFGPGLCIESALIESQSLG